MKKFLLLLFLFPLIGNSQSSQRFYTALLPNPQGQNYVAVIPNASVYVCQYNVDVQCTTPVAIYADTELTQPIVQPLLADGSGVYSYYIQSGTQVVEKVCAPFDQCSSYIVQIGDSGGSGGGGGCQGTIAGDDTSTDCGFQNQTDTGFTPPMHISTFGYLNADEIAPRLPGKHAHVVAMGNQSFVIGRGNTIKVEDAVAIGDAPVNSSSTTSTWFNIVAVGNAPIDGPITSGTDLVAIGDSPLDVSGGGDRTFADIVAIGDDPASDLVNGAFSIVAIGLVPCDLCGGSDQVAIGDTPSNSSTGTDTVAIGDEDLNTGAVLSGNSGNNLVAIGNHSLACNTTGNDNIGIGDYAGSIGWSSTFPATCGNSNQSGSHNVWVGDNVGPNVADGFNDWTIAIGYNVYTYGHGGVQLGHDVLDVVTPADPGINYAAVVLLGEAVGTQGSGVVLTRVNEVVGIGEDALENITSMSDLVSIGDSNLIGLATTGVSNTLSDVVAIGDANAEGMPDGESFDVGIGYANLGAPFNYISGHGSEQIGIGDSSTSGSLGNDVIGIGDEAIGGLRVSPYYYNTGNDLIAIGNHAGQANTTGHDNIYIGDYAGCIGCTTSSVGNANNTGSNNVWIGNEAGPNSTTQLSDTVAIGYLAHPTSSDQIMLGGTSITQMCYSGGGICWFKGTGVPSSGLCTSSNIGSLYSNISGGASTTLYVCTAAATWTAK